MSKFKLGEKITIEVDRERAAKRPARVASREPHYGPERRIDDPTDGPVPANMIFHDPSMRWQDFGDDSHLLGNDHPLPGGVMGYVPYQVGVIDGALDPDTVAGMADDYRTTFFNRDSVKLPAFTGTEYRKVSRALPIARAAADALGLEVKLGSRTFPFKAGSNLTVGASAEKRLKSALKASPQDPAKIAALQKEVHESSFATGLSICRENIVPQLWFTHAERDQRQLWRDAGIFKPKLSAGSYKFSLKDNFYFEPFDLNDTENFKVTKRLDNPTTAATFESPEVDAPKIKVNGASKQCRVYLVPKLWKYELSWVRQLSDQWSDHLGLPNSTVQEPWIDPRTTSGYISAFSSPLILTGWETPINGSTSFFTNHPAYLHTHGDTAWQRDDTSDEAFLRFMMQLSLWLVNAGVEIVPQVPGTSQPPPPGNGPNFDYIRTDLQAQSDAAITITQEGAPAEMLVGGIEVADDNDSRYLVWRKTARVVETDTIYSGAYDDPGYNSVVGGFSFLPPACIKKLHSATWTGSHPANRWTWPTGGLCASDSLWPYLMLPRWCVV